MMTYLTPRLRASTGPGGRGIVTENRTDQSRVTSPKISTIVTDRVGGDKSRGSEKIDQKGLESHVM